jgi:hypothetical protein
MGTYAIGLIVGVVNEATTRVLWVKDPVLTDLFDEISAEAVVLTSPYRKIFSKMFTFHRPFNRR